MKKILLIVLATCAMAAFGVTEAAMKQAGVHEPGTGIGQDGPLLKEENKSGQNYVQDEVDVDVVKEKGVPQNLSEKKGNTNQINNQGESSEIKNQEREGGENENGNGPSDVALQKRSEVANQVHGLLELADRIGGIGEQVRTFAQAQNGDIEKIEEVVSSIQTRSRFAKFFVGGDEDKIKEAKELLLENKQKLETLKELKSEIKNVEDSEAFEQAINQLEEYITETEEVVAEEGNGFSLFGWLFK